MAEMKRAVHLINQEKDLNKLMADAVHEENAKIEKLKTTIEEIEEERVVNAKLKKEMNTVLGDMKEFEECLEEMCLRNGLRMGNVVDILLEDSDEEGFEELSALKAQIAELVTKSPVKTRTVDNTIDSKSISPPTAYQQRNGIPPKMSPLAIEHHKLPQSPSKEVPTPRSQNRFLSVPYDANVRQRAPNTQLFQSPMASSTLVDRTISPQLQLSAIDMKQVSPIPRHQDTLRRTPLRNRSRTESEVSDSSASGLTVNGSTRRQPRRAAAPVSLRELTIEEHARVLQRHFESLNISKKFYKK